MASCPHDCPSEPPRQHLQSQQQPRSTSEEVVETLGFARRNADIREAGFRLANRRFRPLSHLTATGARPTTPRGRRRTVARLKARLNAASDSYPTRVAISRMLAVPSRSSCFASVMRQLARYRIGASPTSCVNRSARTDRDIAASRASSSTVQFRIGLACSSLSALPTCGSLSPPATRRDPSAAAACTRAGSPKTSAPSRGPAQRCSQAATIELH